MKIDIIPPKYTHEICESLFHGYVHVYFHGRTCAHEVTITVYIVNSANGRPELVPLEPWCRVSSYISRIVEWTGVSGDHSRSMWCLFQRRSSTAIAPDTTSSISLRMYNMASQNRSISALSSDSVGSTIIVPPTGQDIVGEWKP